MDASKLDLGGALAYGADYNPEQFDDATFARDLELMRQAQVNLVSLGIFSWTRLEPSEGNYRLDWLEQLIDRLWLPPPPPRRPGWGATTPILCRCALMDPSTLGVRVNSIAPAHTGSGWPLMRSQRA